jgi:hypothetical protein
MQQNGKATAMPLPSQIRSLAAAALFAAIPATALAAADEATPTPGVTPNATPDTLSQKLGQSNGVIHPKDVDPNMDKSAPTTGDQNVIRPPTGDGGQAPQAK